MIRVEGKIGHVDMVSGPMYLHRAAAMGDQVAAAHLRRQPVPPPGPRVKVGDRVEVTRTPKTISRSFAQKGDRGTVISVSPDEVKKQFGLDAEEAYVRLDRIPDEPMCVYFRDLKVLSVVDRIGELDEG